MVCYCLRVWTTRHDTGDDSQSDGNSESDINNRGVLDEGTDTDTDTDTGEDADIAIGEPNLSAETRRGRATDKMHDARRLFPWND